MNTKDKLMEKIVQICDEAGVFYNSKDSIAFDNLVEKLLALISQERERLLKEVEEKVIGKDSEHDYSVVHRIWATKEEMEKTFYSCDFCRMINQVKAEQRKALSDIGGGK